MDTKSIQRQLESVINTFGALLPPLRVAQTLFEQIDSPTSLGLFLCCKYEDIESLVRHRVHPKDYLDNYEGLRAFKWDYQACSLLAKYPFKGVTDTEEAAKQASRESESDCSKANDRLATWLEGGNAPSDLVSRAILLAKDRVSQILGDFPSDEWLDKCRFGPGVTAEDSATHVFDKIQGSLGINPSGYQLACAAINSSQSWRSSHFRVPSGFEGPLPLVTRLPLMDYGVRTYVPKTAVTDRPIEIQPGMSVYMQLGIGALIREQLKLVGIDLDQGWRHNQHLAYRGSIDDSIVTADLKSASDSICYTLVNWIVPADWLHAMTLCRPRFLLDGDKLVETERFSSMGNGYTFELESLIFYSLGWACSILSDASRRDLTVFGDDIAVGAPAWPLLQEVFTFCGFTFNTSKTFGSGAFRESCGADWYLGVDISPLRIKEEVLDVPTTLELANRVRRYSCDHGRSDYGDSTWRPMWLRIVNHLPKIVRRFLSGPPDLYGDGWLHDDQDFYLQNPMLRVYADRGFDRKWIRVPRVSSRVRVRKDPLSSSVVSTMLYALALRRVLDTEFDHLLYRLGSSSRALAKWSRLVPTASASGEVEIPSFRVLVKHRIRVKPKPLHTPLTSVWI